MQLLAARLRQQHPALIDRNIGPADRRLLQGEIVGGVLVGIERHARLDVGLVADRADQHAVVAGRQVLHDIAALIVGQHADGHLQAGMAGLHKGAAERRAIGTGDRTGEGRGVGNRRGQEQT
jgi:hypothetical protein